MRVVAIVQARTGSTRLPGKVAAPIAGRPMLAWVLERALAIPGVDAVVLATTNLAQDRSLDPIATSLGVATFAGSEQDVLDRYYEAAVANRAEAVVRVTADCPLLDPVESGRV